jgi:uncharacterized protein (DUF1810 family)
MAPVKRRFFMKTLLGTAASAAPACINFPRRIGSLSCDADGAPAFTQLENSDQQLRISSVGERLTFQNFLRVAGEWKPATLAGVPVVTGASFPLVTSHSNREGSTVSYKGHATAAGLDGKPLAYDWDADVTATNPSLRAPWFRFRTVLHLPSALRLHQAGSVEPQIIVWLSSSSTLMEGQSGSWRRVLLQQPTRNSLGTYGNDLPAVYALDQNLGVETMMYFDIGDMGWMSTENLPRFLVYRCSTVSRMESDGTQRLGVGLIANQATGDILPAGEVRFTYWLLQRQLPHLLTEQEALARWMEALLPLFEERLTWPPCAANWKDFAARTVEDLQNKDATQVSVNGHAGLRAYVKKSSQIWKQPADNFELMTVADVLWPSLLYLRLHPSPGYENECKGLLADLPGFYHSDTHSISNDYMRPPNERADSWYPFENALIKYPTIGSLSGSKEITDKFLDAFQTSEKMAHQYNYLFPIYYQVATLRAEGAGTNYAVGGLYAWSAILAHRLTGDEHYLEEARRAVRVLYTVPSDRLFHEPQELAYGALAAAELGMRDEATYLLYEQLRMFYWYSDPSQKSHDVRGMVQAAASILYPAFKENVEAILPWTGILKRGIVFEGLLRFMDQQRRNNFYFFQSCSGTDKRAPMAFIPFENLGTLELGGQTGNVGQEIYGAGESLWMYLMFEALGQVRDRELMLVNLDLLDVFDAKLFPSNRLNFILYNPTAERRTATISVPPEQGRKIRFSENGKTVSDTIQVPGHAIVRLLAEY